MRRVYNPLREKNVKSLNGDIHIRAYHGCRPLFIEDYFKKRSAERPKREMLSEAIGRLASLGLSENDISLAFNTVCEGYHRQDDDNGGVYLDTWKTEFYNGISHYLIYGSEIINTTADKLAPNRWRADHFRDKLIKQGDF